VYVECVYVVEANVYNWKKNVNIKLWKKKCECAHSILAILEKKKCKYSCTFTNFFSKKSVCIFTFFSSTRDIQHLHTPHNTHNTHTHNHSQHATHTTYNKPHTLHKHTHTHTHTIIHTTDTTQNLHMEFSRVCVLKLANVIA